MNITSVLVVDDDSAVCHMLRLMLPDGQYEVRTGQSVAEALEAIEQKPFSVYVLDYKLPDGSGLDIAERIRSERGSAPIILISGYNPGAVALRAEKLCISDFLEKPFSRETICNAVKKAADSPSAQSPALEASESERSRTKPTFLQEAVLAIKRRCGIERRT